MTANMTKRDERQSRKIIEGQDKRRISQICLIATGGLYSLGQSAFGGRYLKCCAKPFMLETKEDGSKLLAHHNGSRAIKGFFDNKEIHDAYAVPYLFVEATCHSKSDVDFICEFLRHSAESFSTSSIFGIVTAISTLAQTTSDLLRDYIHSKGDGDAKIDIPVAASIVNCLQLPLLKIACCQYLHAYSENPFKLPTNQVGLPLWSALARIWKYHNSTAVSCFERTVLRKIYKVYKEPGADFALTIVDVRNLEMHTGFLDYIQSQRKDHEVYDSCAQHDDSLPMGGLGPESFCINPPRKSGFDTLAKYGKYYQTKEEAAAAKTARAEMRERKALERRNALEQKRGGQDESNLPDALLDHTGANVEPVPEDEEHAASNEDSIEQRIHDVMKSSLDPEEKAQKCIGIYRKLEKSNKKKTKRLLHSGQSLKPFGENQLLPHQNPNPHLNSTMRRKAKKIVQNLFHNPLWISMIWKVWMRKNSTRKEW